ncbi:MAG: DUF4384 domain-containing protein [Thermodesulfobacteriota bacterium]|nr:DUF4384 domain-containing protein [Thermodesulfobacteriota bacterium]
MKQLRIWIVIILLLASWRPPAVYAEPNRKVTNVTGQGACIIDRITAEQAKQIALRRARAAAIEKAAGVTVQAATVVKNSTTAVDFIKSYARGYIVRETLQWAPLGQYQETPDSAPIPEYRVAITADVVVPEKTASYGLTAELNRTFFQQGEDLAVNVSANKPVAVALFNIMADDRVTMIYPTRQSGIRTAGPHQTVYPPPDSGAVWEMAVLPGHDQNAEAIFVAAALPDTVDFFQYFTPLTTMAITQFFARYSQFTDQCQDVLLPYVVHKKEAE